MPPGPDSEIPTAPPGIDLFLFIAYCERTISGPGRFQAQIPGFGYSFNWPLLSFHDLRRILSVGLSFPSTICVVFFQLGSQFLPQFASYSFNWVFISFHDLHRILSIGLSFPSTICIVFFQVGSHFLTRFASYSFNWALISVHDLRRSFRKHSRKRSEWRRRPQDILVLGRWRFGIEMAPC